MVSIMHATLRNESVPTKIIYIWPASHPRNQTWNQMDAKTKNVYPILQYANYLICIFMKNNENIRNERKIIVKLKCVPIKLCISRPQILVRDNTEKLSRSTF